MSNLTNFSFLNELPDGWPLLLGAALVAVLLAESAFVLFSTSKEYRRNVNRRLAVQEVAQNREEALIQLRRERGLDEGMMSGPLAAIQRMMTQSGLTIGWQKLVYIWAASPLIVVAIAFIFEMNSLPLLALAAGVGLLLPLLVLRFLQTRRINKFSEQLPDAIDMIVRSLKAGHPLPIAITLVSREMLDPIGSEFGMVADELSYGLDLETAMRNMAMRVGQDDLPLFVTSISIQAATGGNLAAILEGLSKVIRDRFRMRRKIVALSSEAKMSAKVLIALPFIIYLMINMADPSYFEVTRGKPQTPWVLYGSLCWMSVGVLIMRKLVNMKI
jgi:tight adherence protein B